MWIVRNKGQDKLSVFWTDITKGRLDTEIDVSTAQINDFLMFISNEKE